mmetsp:Transcript_12890/g.29167  ORF Transcript_12890/g.29167 Transcript_12890/m.29167 type:complete len:97 (+) Transcript_12890:54-344(+)
MLLASPLLRDGISMAVNHGQHSAERAPRMSAHASSPAEVCGKLRVAVIPMSSFLLLATAVCNCFVNASTVRARRNAASFLFASEGVTISLEPARLA